MSQALNNGSKEVSASYFYLSDLQHIENLADYADSLVIFRTPYDTDVDRVMTRFRRAGKKVFRWGTGLIWPVRPPYGTHITLVYRRALSAKLELQSLTSS